MLSFTDEMTTGQLTGLKPVFSPVIWAAEVCIEIALTSRRVLLRISNVFSVLTDSAFTFAYTRIYTHTQNLSLRILSKHPKGHQLG